MALINILFPVIGFFITLGISMMLIGFLQKSETKPLRTVQLAVVILVPLLFVQLLAVASRSGIIDYSLSYHVMAAYFVFPLLFFFLWHKKPLIHSALYSVIILLSAICSRVLLGILAYSVMGAG